MLRVSTRADFGFFHLFELLYRVSAGGLEQAVAGNSRAGVGDDQRARHQLRQQVDDRELVDTLVGGDPRSRLDGEAAGEDRETAQHDALGFRKHVVAPVERRAQRLLTRQRGTRSAREQSEAITQTSIDLLDRQGAGARGSEFQRQRDTIEMDAYFRNGGRSARSQLEIGVLARTFRPSTCATDVATSEPSRIELSSASHTPSR